MKLDLSGDRLRLDLTDPALRLTRAQAQAMATDREIIVSAGAGAGKTHTLALRYVALLLELAEDAVAETPASPRPDIEGVLVLTFTEKAAQEMAERCYQRLLQLAGEIRTSKAEITERYDAHRAQALAAAVDHLVDTFTHARIHTFHGFCARLLQEFPAETRTAPGFEVLDQGRADALRLDAVERAFAELAANDADGLALLMDAFGNRYALIEALSKAVAERGVLRERMQAHARAQVSERWLLQRAPLDPESVRSWLVRRGKPTIEVVCTVLAPVMTVVPWLTECDVLRLRERLRLLPDDPLHLNELYLTTLRCLLDSKNARLRSLRSYLTIGKTTDWPDRSSYKAAKEHLEAVWDGCADWPERVVAAERLPTRADRTLLDVLRVFSTVALRAEGLLKEGLAERNAMDFAGLQLRAAQAIERRQGLLAQLRRRHRYLMVDEFQDTDQVQWDIVRAIGRPEGPDAPSDRIFLVGDTKQAIYGFRGGDVTVFAQAREDLGIEPQVFPENFRSHPRLIDWFNDFFMTVLGAPSPARPAFEAHYEPLVAGREDPPDAPGGSITLVQHSARPGPEAAELEAQVAARFIGGRILTADGPFALLDPLNREKHPSPPVAILIRARTHLSRWESALREHGIAYVVAGGVGFWRRPEVMDLVNALDTLANRERTSLVGLLRSPLFCVEDQHIQDLYSTGFLDGFDFRKLPEGTAPAILEAQTRLRRLVRMRDRLPPAALLDQLIADCAAWHLYGLEDDGGQAEANARRLVGLVHTMDQQSVGSLEDVARQLVEQVRQNARESEASVTPAAARVVLMTVHASKGLEFPVVVIPGLADLLRPVVEPLIVRRLDGRWEMASRAPDRHAAVQRRVKPGLLRELAEVRKREELAEHKRLLYVAATRARDHVVLLGRVNSRAVGEPATWMDMVQSHHGTPPIPGAHLDVLDADDLLELAVPRTTAPAPLASPTRDARRNVAPLATTWEIEVSPSGLDLYLECPARWYRRHLLGVSEHVNRRQVREEALAAARGEVIHSLLEDGLADQPELARARWEARAHAEGLAADEVERLLPRLLDHLARSAADPWLQRVMGAPGWPEVPFRIPHKDLVVRGKVDRIWRDPDSGAWSVLDYKSEALAHGARESAKRHETQLLSYVWAANKVLSGRGHGGVSSAQLYFTELAEAVELGPYDDARLAGFEALLEQIADMARLSWTEVERAVTEAEAPRPCRDCGFFTRGCSGWRPPEER